MEAARPSRARVSVNRIAVYCPPGVAVMNHPGPHRSARLVPAPQRHRQAVLDERDVFDRRGRAAHDRPGVQLEERVDELDKE
jgi:hypothetical protein